MTEELDKIMKNVGEATDSAVVGLSNTIRCVDALIDFIGDQKVSMKEHPHLLRGFDWLTAVRENVGKELKEVMAKNNHPDEVREALENANAIN